MSSWIKNLIGPGFREFFWPSALLVISLLLALISSTANRNGLYSFAVITAISALIFAAIVSVTLIPRLLKRVRIEYWSTIHFFRVTKRGAFFLLLIGMIAVSTFNTGNNLLIIVLSFLLSALLVSGMFSNLVLYGLQVHLQIPDMIHAGQNVMLVLGLENVKRKLPSFSVILKGQLSKTEDLKRTDFSFAEKHFPYIRPAETLTVKVGCQFEKRGVYPVRAFQVRTQFPFGFVSRGRRIETDGKITVFPALLELDEIFLRHPFLQGPETRHRKGKGTGLYNIRDYQRGDDARFVSWKSSAKLSRLMVKEFLLEEEDFLILAFSTFLPDQTEENLNQFEKAVSYIATLACFYREKGQGFSFYSGEFESDLNGSKESFRTLLEYLAWVQPSKKPNLDSQKIGPGTVVFTAGTSSDLKHCPQVDYLQL
jgi:uncharacterized protein (DUF58 family)